MPRQGVTPETWVTLGRVSGLFGVRGWMRVYSHCEPRAGILDYSHWWLGPDTERRRYKLLEGRAQGPGVVVRLEGIEDRDGARAHMGLDIAVPRSALAEIEGFYWADLIGLEVENRDGVKLGRIAGHIETGGHDVIVVADGARERLIPYAPGRYVDEVVLGERRMIVDWHPDD
ncbi:MAG: ribosome maturation factor RimM [Gammaproteobacteria bacterium]|nr:ribosome maturation factor RimM [Gammaproteobacteria bacterium]